MPGMPRLEGKATKIAFKLLGVPGPLRKEKNSKKKAFVNRRLLFEETSRVR